MLSLTGLLSQSCIFVMRICACVFQGIPVALDNHILGFDTGGDGCFHDDHDLLTSTHTGSLVWIHVSTYSVITAKVNSIFSSFSDATLNEAAQILRLLHIEELRELQTRINEAIVAVQAIIADPKTDHRLGKVGR